MGAGGAGKAPPPLPPPAPPAAGAAAGAAAGVAAAAAPLPVMPPQARLPQPTVFDGATPPLQEWVQETRNFLSINNYEFIRQMDYSLQSDREVTLQDVTNSTRIGRERRDALDVNEEAQDTLNREYDTPLAERDDAGRTNVVCEGELDVVRNQHIPLQQAYDEWLDRLEERRRLPQLRIDTWYKAWHRGQQLCQKTTEE